MGDEDEQQEKAFTCIFDRVTMYAMMCGTLPFEDPSTAKLYEKILGGEYQRPTHLSDAAVSVTNDGCLTTHGRGKGVCLVAQTWEGPFSALLKPNFACAKLRY